MKIESGPTALDRTKSFFLGFSLENALLKCDKLLLLVSDPYGFYTSTSTFTTL